MGQLLFKPDDNIALHVEAFLELVKLFPDIDIAAVYLMGSYVDGTHVESSDLDFAVIYKKADPARLKAIQRFFDTYSRDYLKKEVDLYLISLEQIEELQEDALLTREGILNVKIASELIYGTDVRHKISLSDTGKYIGITAVTPFHFMQKIRGEDSMPKGSLDYPNEVDYFYGYLDHAGVTHRGLETKPVLSLIGWICTAKIALSSGEFVGKKSDVVRLYNKHVGGEWVSFVESAYELIRNELAYHLPETTKQKQALRDLCQALLRFERLYATEYEHFTKRST